MPNFILASASPRRRELLAQLGVKFTVHAADIDESIQANQKPGDYVQSMARQKAAALAEKYPDSVILAADTIVCLGDQIFGKPKDFLEFSKNLNVFKNNWHTVMTAVCVQHGERAESILVQTEIQWADISESEIKQYWQTGEPADKAGGYAIQGLGGQWITQIRGSYSNVVGLPLHETKVLLMGFLPPSK